MTVPRPSLDVSGEPWVGEFPGLGRVLVGADGTVTTEPEAGAQSASEPPELREQALRWGWGDLLAARRQSFDLLMGVALVPPPYEAGVLLVGDGRNTSRWHAPLAAAGWRFLSDRPSPARVTDSGVVLQPRAGPVLTSRRDAPEAPSARLDSDAALLEEPRHLEAVPLRCVVVLEAERVRLARVSTVRGAERLPVALGLLAGGVLAAEQQTPEERLAAALALAAHPVLRVRCGAGAPDPGLVAEVLTWVSRHDEGP